MPTLREINDEDLENRIKDELAAYNAAYDESNDPSGIVERLKGLYEIRESVEETEEAHTAALWDRGLKIADQVVGVLKWLGGTLVVVTLYREGLEFEKTGVISSTFVKDLSRNATSILRIVR